MVIPISYPINRIGDARSCTGWRRRLYGMEAKEVAYGRRLRGDGYRERVRTGACRLPAAAS
jgi:hypothetical protein